MAAVVSRDRSSEEHALDLRGGAPFAGKYAVERILGQGGMGTVFEARHLRLGHRVAIKVLGSELRDYPELVTRFEREARAAGALSSRHAVRVFDIDMTEDATPFIVMELLSGRDLARILEREGPQPVGRAVGWLIEACDAIAEAHRLGIIHRDIKPSNLFLSDDGVKVLDFGIAKRVASKEASITHAVAPLGTPQYMSPEQVRCAKDVDARTDVWSVGVTLYELLTGRTPFAHESPSACIASIAADPVPDPRTIREDLPADLAAVIMRALRKDPAERYASIDELVEALAPFADQHPTSAVREVVATAASHRRRDESTLDGDDVVLASGVHSSVRVDSTVPPAVSRAPLPPKKRSRTSSLAIASAALVGLAALVVTPKWLETLAAPPTSGVRTSTPASPTATAITPTTVAAPTLAVAPAPVEAAEPAPAPQPITTVAAPIVTAAPKKARPASTAKARAEATTIVRTFPSDSPVHGGLSSPGF